MTEHVQQGKPTSAITPEWLFQTIASVAWMVSVFIYGSYGLGDWLQLTAASAWTVSNLLSFRAQKKALSI